MKITKFVHSCLLVEMPEPINRTVLFDPGSMSQEMLQKHPFQYLDDIFITHSHDDHMDIDAIRTLQTQFPDVRILAPADAAKELEAQGVTATTTPPQGVTLFESPHEDVEPLFPTPQEIGIHYIEKLSHPGDSHSFTETMPVLALPVQAPWGASLDAIRLAIKLKPRYVIPIHDWHWSDAARVAMYDRFQQVLGEHDVTFIKPVNGEPFVLDI